MNIIKTAPFAFWMYYNLKRLKNFKKLIEQAKASGDIELEKESILNATKTWGDSISQKYDLHIDVEGNTNFPKGPVAFVSNHQGYGDILSFCMAIRSKQFGFIAKQELFEIPVFGRWIERIRSISLPRDDARASIKALDKATEYLKSGFSLVIFPEGTRSKSDSMSDFKKGSLKLATKAKVPIIPVTISGSWRIYEELGYIQKGTRVKFYFHPPIYTEDMERKEASNLHSQVEEIVRNKLNEYNSQR